MVEVMKIMVTSLKRSHACTATLSVPNTLEATTDPCLCQRLLDTHRQVWVSLLWGHCSFLLGPGLHKVMTNLDSILKSRDITLPTEVCLVKAVVFPVVVYGCESWTVKKAGH